MSPTPHAHIHTLVDFCLANHPDIHAVTGLTESEVRKAATLLRAAPALLQNLLDSRDAVSYYHEHEDCPDLLTRRRAAIAQALAHLPSTHTTAPSLFDALHAMEEAFGHYYRGGSHVQGCALDQARAALTHSQACRNRTSAIAAAHEKDSL